jgi:hypothetical protein
MFMDQENIYDKIQELLGDLQGSYNILEEQIDLDVQMEYFESSKSIKKSFNTEETLNEMGDLFSCNKPISEKKLLLSRLATIDNVNAYRTIEKYKNNSDPELQDWAILAMQESRMLLESSFLDENQVFISTGMGGKGTKLRYFVVFIAKQKFKLKKFHQKIIRTESEYTFKKYDAEIEEMNFSDDFVAIKTVIPITVQLNDIFEDTIVECNQFGDFLEMNFIVTNVKELSFSEIQQVLITSKTSDDSKPISESNE